MKRVSITPRKNWESKIEENGFIYHSIDGVPYWDESAAYEFSMDEINKIEAATNELQEIVTNTIQHVIDYNRFDEMGINSLAKDLILKSWNNDEISLYGRFDLAYDGIQIKMLEYNADTPTALPETAVHQWFWLEELYPNKDQFNSIHERLIKRWKEISKNNWNELHFACMRDSDEDFGNIRYLGDTAAQAGIKCNFVYIDDIGWDSDKQLFVGDDNEPIINIFKLYPWEFLLADKFGENIPKSTTRWVEPAWKMLLSNKALLPLAWEYNPNHPNLLEASFKPLEGNYVKKPFFSREGANISINKNGTEMVSGGTYSGPYIYQRLFDIPNIDGNFPILGSWIIGEEAAGMGIRENNNLITTNLSRFVPHYIS